tara:strand:+ start:1850 stop:2116 length:267 start_codon:yes stop_codon:yes gene_type:complete
MRVIQNSEAGSFEATLYPSLDLWTVRIELETGERITLQQSLIEWGAYARQKKSPDGSDARRNLALDRLYKGVLSYGFTNTKQEGVIYD